MSRRKTALQVRCYEWQADAYHRLAKVRGVSLSTLVRELLERELEERAKECTTESALQSERES